MQPIMRPATNKELLRILVKAYNNTITDYFYFPEVVYAGTQKIESADFEVLLAQGLITLSKYDSFGRYFTLSKKGDQLLQQHLAKSPKKKPASVPLTQGCFYFNRLHGVPSSGARCLLFF